MAVSVREVAAVAGVSVGTVSNVLNWPEKVASGTVERVHSAIAELGYVRNDAARQLRVGRSRSIGLIVPDVANPFFADVARGASARAQQENLAVLLAGSDDEPAREDVYLDLFREQRVNGVLISPARDTVPKLMQARDAGMPIVLVDRELPDTDFASVTVDDVEGGALAVQHLLDTGRRRILFLGGPASISQVADRLAGARRAIAGVPDASLEVIAQEALTVLAGRRAGQAIAARPVHKRPDAIFAANDLLVMGLIQAFALENTIRVPQEIALIGYDDIDFAAAAVVPLSSIRQPAREIGETAVALLLRLLADPDGDFERRVQFRPELVVRASTQS